MAWVHTPTYVAWVPLAPGEIYYGYGYYGPHSVDVRNINVNRINISNVYVNARAVNAVTVMNRQTFLTGRPERVVNAPRNPFTAGVKPSIGRPDIKPVRATALPNPLKVISQKQLPSREIVTRAAKIKDRPVATHKDISVFKPGERAPSMHVNNLDRPKPVTSVKKPELGQPQMQRGQGGPSGPSTHREFGVAPPSKGQSAAPPARKEQMNKPPSPSTGTPQIQRPQSVTPKREQMNTPPAQRRDLGPSSVQKGQTGGPSTQREFGVAPLHTGGSNAPPVQKGGSGGGSSSSPHGRKEQR